MRDFKQLIIRVPADIKSWLQEQAKRNHRTLQGEVRARLDKTIEEERPQREEEVA